MFFLYDSKNWFFDDYDKMLKFLGSYHNQWTDRIYEYWLENSNDKFKNQFYDRINRFINTKDLIFSIKHQNN